MIIDVDCTTDEAKKLCENYGVQGYPSLKYFGPGFSDMGEEYDGGRDYEAMKKFVKQKSKKPCVPDTLENCNKKDQAYLEEIKDLDAAALTALREKMEKEIADQKQEHKDLQDLFEKQKDEAMATMKKAEEAKKKLGKLSSKFGSKLLILKAKEGPKKDEL